MGFGYRIYPSYTGYNGNGMWKEEYGLPVNREI